MLLERDSQLARLAQLVDHLDATGGKIVLLHGDAGVGKSSLVAACAAQHAGRAHVLIGTCDDLLTPQPLGAIWDIARGAPTVAAALETDDRRVVHDALLDLLASSLRPTIVIIEDCHWADEATMDAITFIGRRLGRITNGLLLLTYRQREIDAAHPLRQVIGTLPAQSIERIGLEPLSAEAVATLIHDTDFAVDEVMALTGGNALYVTELLFTAGDGVPESVQDSVLARVARLSPGARRLVQLVSVSPGGIERSVVERLVQPTADQLAECARKELVQADGDRLAFRHEVVRRAVEVSLDEAVRARLHSEVLGALRGTALPALLAHHAAAAGDEGAVVEIVPLAARAAMSVGSYREAAAHCRSLEPYLDRIAAPERAALLEEWARALFYIDDAAAAAATIQRAIEVYHTLEDRMAAGRALTFSVRPLQITGQPELARANSDAAIELLAGRSLGKEFAFALAQRAWLEWVAGDDTALALEYAARGMAAADDADDEVSWLRAALIHGDIEFSRGDPAGMRLIEDVRERAQRGGHGFEEALALSQMAGLSADIREIARARDLVQRARETAARYEMRTHELNAQAMFAEILFWQGEWSAAEDAAGDVLDSSPHTAMIGWRVLGNIQARRGQPGAGSALQQVWAMAVASDELQTLDPAATVLAEYAWLSRESEPELVNRLCDVYEMGLRRGVPWPSGALCFWLWKLGVVDSVPDTTSVFYRWIIEGEWRRAAEFWNGRGAPYDEALALMHGDEDAQRRAVRIFEDLEADAAANRLRRDLAAGGIIVPRGAARSTRRHVAGLTARQAQILELLAESLSNGEIADRLFLSLRTVENHVAAILLKLDASGRVDAVAIARQRGILATA